MEFSKTQLIELISCRGKIQEDLHQKAKKIKQNHVGKSVYLRGLIEFSNICSKNCYYCGIRAGNSEVNRYTVSEKEVIEAAKFAYKNGFGSIVLQSGECSSESFTETIERILCKVTEISKASLGVTLSLGEQSYETYAKWKKAGASRYLLRIETSNPNLYKKLHPQNHPYEKRVEALYMLKSLSYQVGSGIMVGLPFQTIEDLADDILFFKKMDLDMIGMGPYIEHKKTPLYAYKDSLLSKEDRYQNTLNILALLRISMPDINMAATTAMGSLKHDGREEAIRIAANVIMPNLTPFKYREDYFLYDNKLCIEESHQDSKASIEALIKRAGSELVYGEQGNSLHYKKRF